VCSGLIVRYKSRMLNVVSSREELGTLKMVETWLKVALKCPKSCTISSLMKMYVKN
jgi:hypothetical protein